MAPKKTPSKPSPGAGTSSATALDEDNTFQSGGLSSFISPPTPSSPGASGFIPSPTVPETADQTASRIIKHMNADHSDSLARYIQYFGRVWGLSARAPELLRLSRSEMTIASTGPVGTATSRGLHTTIKFEPELSPGLADARKRLIEMDREATRGLGRKEVTVRRYIPPSKNWELAWIVFVAFAWIVLGRRQNFFEGTYFFEGVLRWLPTGTIVWLRTMQPRIFLMMLGLHFLETAEMVIGKMRGYNVELGSSVWWAWVLDVAFEGFPVWGRLDKVIEEETERKKRTMH